MLVIRNERFIRCNGEIYLTGSSSNRLYENNLYCMRNVTYLGWVKEDNKIDVNKYEKYVEQEGMNLDLHDEASTTRQKLHIIKNAVKNATAVSVKLPITDAMIACFYALKYKKPFVVESGGYAWGSLWYHGGSTKYKLAAYPVEWIVRFFHKRAKFIIYVSKDFIQKVYPSKAIQVGCPDVVMNIPDETVLNQRLDKINHPPNTYTLGLIGATQAEYRGHDTLIEVASILKSRGHDVKVCFVGGGTKDAERLACAKRFGMEDKVVFQGRLTHDEVFQWIDDIDVLVMPTLQETLGRAVVEAMSRGCPVVGSAETAISEQIGLDCIAPARDANKIADAVENIITNPYYASACAKENFYRSFKYASVYTNTKRKQFYDTFYKNEFGE